MLSKIVFICLLFWQSSIPCGFIHEPKCSSAFDLVYQSTDGGLTWQDVSSGLPSQLEVTDIFSDDREIILSSASGIYRSQTGLKNPSWKKDMFLNDKISSVFKGRSGNYARNFDNGFYKEYMNTGTWLPVFKNLKEVWKWSFLETPNGALFIGSDHGIFKSGNNGQSWFKVLADEKVLDLIQYEGMILASSFEGIFKSTDHGESWQRVLKESNVIRNMGIIGDQVFAITYEEGPQQKAHSNPKEMANKLLISSDLGKTWKRIDERLIAGRFVYQAQCNSNPTWFINDVAKAGEFLVCSIDAGIFRSADQGKTWTRVFTHKENQIFNFTTTGKVIYAVKANKGC
ncbi:MAG: hypothetical protein IPM34_06675 [Saprospiraceae bacterium]|nr:hypothetical protein [Saprospiraceae bacterium]